MFVITSLKFQKTLDECKLKLKSKDNVVISLNNKIKILQNENSQLIQKKSELKDEIDSVKIYHNTKQNKLNNEYKKLLREYQHLKMICEKGKVTFIIYKILPLFFRYNTFKR